MKQLLEFQATAHKFGAFTQALQAPIPGAFLIVENFEGNTLAVIAKSKTQMKVIIQNLHVDAPCLRVAECIKQEGSPWDGGSSRGFNPIYHIGGPHSI